MFTFTTHIQHCSGGTSHWQKQEEELKGTQIEKEEMKLSLSAYDMIVYVENLKQNTKEQTELSEFSKVSGYKVNM